MVDTRAQEIFKDSVRKEDLLRLKWFYRNEERLVAFSEKPLARTVPAATRNAVKDNRVKRYQGREKHIRPADANIPKTVYDPDKILPIMKPVDPAHTQLIYTARQFFDWDLSNQYIMTAGDDFSSLCEGTQKDGRLNYLHERVRILPENRYYNPETTSYQYGWNMWNAGKTATDVRYGKCQVIKNSFYRRNGVAPDPPWYQEPAILNPNICNCS